MNSYLLTSLTLLPIAAGLLLLVTRGDGAALRKLAIALSFLPLCMIAVLRRHFDIGSGELQFIERREWFTAPNVEYFLGLDGVGFLMALLTAIAIPFAIVATAGTTDTGSIDFAQGGFASLITFDGGGQARLRGDFDASQGTTSGDYLGTLCTP